MEKSARSGMIGRSVGSLAPVVVLCCLGILPWATAAQAASAEVIQMAGGYSHTVALLSDGTVQAWGYNTFGQLGDGTTNDSLMPVEVIGLGGPVTAIAAGAFHTVALLSDGTVQAWGHNGQGQLGDGTITGSPTPVTVTGLGGTGAAVDAGYGHTVALLTDGTVKTWGGNHDGQLGAGPRTQTNVPIAVTRLKGTVAAVAAGESHTVALLADGTVWAWGQNLEGELGDGTGTNSRWPVAVVGLGGPVTAVAAGTQTTMALLADGRVQSWGYNRYGQLGDGTTVDSLVPVTVMGFDSPVTAIAAGGDHNLALLADGTVRAWGWSLYGQLGTGVIGNKTTPALVMGMGGETRAIGAGWFHSLALSSSGTPLTWGRNDRGQLGEGTTTDSHLPVTAHIVVPCAAPSGITVPAADADGAYTVRWEASATDGVTYLLQEATDPRFTENRRTLNARTRMSLRISDRSPNSTYYYRVKAHRDGYADSAWQTTGNGCAVPGSGRVSRPSGITVPLADDDGDYTVSWGPSPTPGVTYVLEEATDPTFTAGLRVAYAGVNLARALAGRDQNKTYYYRVRATKEGERDSAWQVPNRGCAVPGMAQIKAPPAITLPAVDNDGAYTVQWAPSITPGVKYLLEEAMDSAFTKGQRTAYFGNSLSAAVTGRSAGETYFYRVIAVKPGLVDSGRKTAENGCLIVP